MAQRQKHLVSVIIPVKNRLDYLVKTLESVRSQKLPAGISLETIVIDDGSVPTVSSVVDNSNVKVFVNNGVGGPADARNLGYKKSSGDYICFLDSDDFWNPNFLAESIAVLKLNDISTTVCLSNTNFSGMFSLLKKIKILVLNFVKNFVLIFNYIFNNGILPKSGFFLCQLSHMVFCRKYISNKRFNTDMSVAEDWDYNVAATYKKNIGIIPRKLVNFRYEKKSLTNDKKIVDAKKSEYYKLLSTIPQSHKRGILYLFFIIYIELFLLK